MNAPAGGDTVDYGLFVEARVTADQGVPPADLLVLPYEGTRRVHARLDPQAPQDPPPRSPELGGLPYYVGARATLLSAPKVLLAVWRAVGLARVVVVKQPGVIGIMATISARMQSKPVAVSVVGDIGDVMDSGVAGRLGQWGRRLAVAATRRVVRQADITHYVTRRTLQETYPPRPGTRTFTFSNVNVVDISAIERRRDRHRLSIVGSQENSYKGHDVAIRSLGSLLRVVPGVELLIIGDGREASNLRALAAELGVLDRIEFAGRVSSREKIDLRLRSTDVFLMPSRTEGLPRAVIEAMSHGLPCVGSAVGGIPELVHPSMLVPVGDSEALATKAAALLRDDALWDSLQAHSLEIAESYLFAKQEAERESFRAAVAALRSGR